MENSLQLNRRVLVCSYILCALMVQNSSSLSTLSNRTSIMNPSLSISEVGDKRQIYDLLSNEELCVFFRTEKLRNACMRIAQNPVVKSAESITRSSSSDACDSTCPAYTGSTSYVSPWKTCVDTDDSRYPRQLSYAKCSCLGCLNPYQNWEEDNSLVSQEIKVKFDVIIFDDDVEFYDECTDETCHEESMEIAVGCTCIVPESV